MDEKMERMTDMKKVIRMLNNTLRHCHNLYNHVTSEEQTWLAEINQGAKEALELLEEQRTHILTIDQLEDALDTVVWLETPVSENLADGYSLIMAYNHKCGWMLFDSPFGDNPSQDRLEYSEYGKSWRCWNKRPTDEQRQEVKWDA